MGLSWINLARRPGGEEVKAVTLTNRGGLEAQIMNYGATLMALRVLDRFGRQVDVVLGFDDAGAYLSDHPYFGAVIGRYANRIADSCFALGDTKYTLHANDGKNHLHGGPHDFHNGPVTLGAPSNRLPGPETDNRQLPANSFPKMVGGSMSPGDFIVSGIVPLEVRFDATERLINVHHGIGHGNSAAPLHAATVLGGIPGFAAVPAA